MDIMTILLVLGSLLFGAIGFLVWLNRTWIRTRLRQTRLPQMPHIPDHNPEFDRAVETPREHPWFFYGITLIWVGFMIAGVILAIINWNTSMSILDAASISLGQTMLVLQLLWLAASIRSLKVDEVGAVTLWGWPMIRVGRGPKLVIFGIFQLQRFVASIIQNQHPAEPELIQKTADEVPLEFVNITLADGTTISQSKVRPIRITTGGPKASLGKEDHLNTQMTLEFTYWVRWIIVDAFDYIINTGGDTEKAVQQMRDVGESLLNRTVTQKTPSELISGFANLEEALKAAITVGVATWGIRIAGVGLTSPDINHEVAKSLRDIAKAKAVGEKTRIDADNESYRLAKVGKGEGKAVEEKLAGEGRGYKRAGKAIGVTPETVLAAQVARDTVGEGDLVLGAEGITQVLGLGRSLLQKPVEPATRQPASLSPVNPANQQNPTNGE